MGYGAVHSRVKGDTFIPLGAQLKANGEPIDLTGLQVQFRLVADGGTVKKNWTAATIVTAATGHVQYDFAAGDVDTAGVYWGWFRYGDGTEWATVPADGQDGRGRSFKIVINDTV